VDKFFGHSVLLGDRGTRMINLPTEISWTWQGWELYTLWDRR